MDAEPLPLANYLPELERLAEEDIDLVLVAGQAVNFWANYYSSYAEELREFAPFVSKDVDLFGEERFLSEIPKVLRGKLKRFRDVRHSVVGIFTMDSDPPLTFELLRSLYGPVSSSRLLARSLRIGKIRVIDPISLLVCKAHNAAGIDQERRQDARHVKMILVVFAYLSDGLSTVGERMTARQFIKEVRYLLEHADNSLFKKGLSMSECSLRECIPIAEIQQARSRFERLKRFADSTLARALESETK